MRQAFWKLLLTAIFAVIFCFNFIAPAQEAIIAEKSEPDIEFCGENVNFDSYNINGSNYVKLRDVASYLGLHVSWNEVTGKIIISEEPVEEKNKYILIDAGHGGAETGARNDFLGILEKDVNLSVATKLYELLKSDGYNVKLTRSDDSTIYLSDRMDMIIDERPDLYISVHHNASEEGYSGAVVLCQVSDENGGNSSYLAKYIGEEFENIGQNYLGEIYKKGEYGDYYGVLRAAADVGVTAVITEFAYIDNDKDVKKIDTQQKQYDEALAIYNAVIKYMSIYG